ncbi:MAG TPA: DUF3887 domain-containing protein, partial [Candidatus Binatus sp.]|nr:DUF3887 domain-containing protein [Candidatus Binatus sp.]
MAKPRTRILLLLALFVLGSVMAGSRPANAITNSRVDELFTALRDRRFTKATEHFDPTMKQQLSADQLSAVWTQIIASEGDLKNWKIISSGQLAGTTVFTVAVMFERGKLLSTVAIRPQTNEIAGL